MKLTTIQADILDHRLGSGCVADVLADTEELGISLEEAESAVASVERMIKSGDLPLESLTRIEREVLIDCLDGSTYFCDEGDAIALGETTRGKQLACHKAANALESAFGKAFGRDVECVRF